MSQVRLCVARLSIHPSPSARRSDARLPEAGGWHCGNLAHIGQLPRRETAYDEQPMTITGPTMLHARAHLPPMQAPSSARPPSVAAEAGTAGKTSRPQLATDAAALGVPHVRGAESQALIDAPLLTGYVEAITNALNEKPGVLGTLREPDRPMARRPATPASHR